SELAVGAGEAVAPMPLLRERLDGHRAFGDADEVAPDEEAGRQHRGDADGRDGRQRDLELLAFRLVMGAMRFTMPVLDEAVRGEEVDRDEDDAGDPERHADGEVDGVPVRRE